MDLQFRTRRESAAEKGCRKHRGEKCERKTRKKINLPGKEKNANFWFDFDSLCNMDGNLLKESESIHVQRRDMEQS